MTTTMNKIYERTTLIFNSFPSYFTVERKFNEKHLTLKLIESKQFFSLVPLLPSRFEALFLP